LIRADFNDFLLALLYDTLTENINTSSRVPPDARSGSSLFELQEQW